MCFGIALRRGLFGLSWVFKRQIKGFGEMIFKTGLTGMVDKAASQSWEISLGAPSFLLLLGIYGKEGILLFFGTTHAIRICLVR